MRETQEAARTLGRQLHCPECQHPSEIDTAFATLAQQRAGALLVVGDPFFTSRRQLIVALAARHAVPDIYVDRDSVEAGGLMSYGTDTDRHVSPGRRSMSAQFSRARSRPTCRSMLPTNSSW